MRTKLLSLPLFYLLFAYSVSFATVDFTSNKVCFGTYSSLIATSSYADSTILYYKWDLNNDGVFTDATGKAISHLFDSVGFYEYPVKVRVFTKDGQHEDMAAFKLVSVNPIPAVNFFADNVCNGKNVIFQSNSTILSGSITQYKWDFNNNGTINSTIGPNVTYNYGQPGTFVAKLEAVSDQNCRAFTTNTIHVYRAPDALFSVQNACLGENTNFINQSTLVGENILYYLWDFGDGQQSTAAGNVSHKYFGNGPFNTKLIAVSANNCKDTFNYSVVINPRPTLSFEIAGDTVFYEGSKVTVTAKGNFNSIVWSSGETLPTIIISKSITDTATVFFTNNNCSTKKSVTVQVIQADAPVILNNIMTPNGDGINDNFVIENLSKFSKCDFVIFNAYGDKVFWQNNYDNSWSGQLNGKSPSLDAGAYYYIIETDKGSFNGCLNILR